MNFSKVISFFEGIVRVIRKSPVHAFDWWWDASRKFFFTITFISLLWAKLLHIYAHLHSLPPSKFLLWGPTFFFQDVLFIILIRLFTQSISWRPVAIFSALCTVPVGLLMSGMASSATSFYVVTGAEIHWRQIRTFHGDAAAFRTLLTGLTGFLVVEAIIIAVSWFVGPAIHRMVGGVVSILVAPFQKLLQRIWRLRCSRWSSWRSGRHADPENYEHIAVDDYLDDKSEDGDSVFLLDPMNPETPVKHHDSLWKRLAVFVFFGCFFFLRCVRPPNPSYMFLSGALPVVPFTSSRRLFPVDATGMPGDYTWLDGRSALDKPPSWDWLPQDPMPGFEDWYPDFDDHHRSDRRRRPPPLHYNPAEDPLHISNLQNPVLDPLRDAFASGNVSIKHVILLKLESTRADVFPLRRNSFMWGRIADSHPNRTIPDAVQAKLANLTRTAEYLTGFTSGFRRDKTAHQGKKAFGGLSARNAFTTGTYTLKSLVGTVCGVTPLVTDFNREYKHHIYQPCMPHVLNALNRQLDPGNRTEDFTSWPWHSKWMQSVTEGYDKQDQLTPRMGFKDILAKEQLTSPRAKHYPVKSKEINYYGYADTELREYFRDAIDDAERDHKRLFITHLTGTTHHPWGMPNNTYQQFMGKEKSRSKEDLNKYLNTIGFVDTWLAEIMDILHEKGVADETLIIMAGDHGLSLPNDGGVTPYDNPHIGSFQVPIVFAHPKIPPVEITAPVISDQIVPTILDLLIESSSLEQKASHAAKDLLSIYEGQSMIRPLIQEQDGKQDWQFTVMNTGGSWLAVRSAAKPAYRLVIPLIDDLEWRFTDLREDPNELHPSKSFDLVDLANTLDKKYGAEVTDWVRDAAHVAAWWVGDNWRRYRYLPTSR
ncbi:sulfatase domain protein [Aspergillus clavatus NRRL 1]|uniref:Sulfatase domain protein n=1 Tax=Aspergillus clavatus (strain ATCC 1007 / CBS 513.65 / DSM 816 / NCTC 3887 / NRRL 1 / QM 1276 / 107) TaxID=344612 RepID=A1C889_ASPCL|nr:sulfatase domain protein [Aspergillus clavatus NRRL 1]EAW14610.1 sulfatase domain protein [Aspergillus clavatus NRRL 1]